MYYVQARFIPDILSVFADTKSTQVEVYHLFSSTIITGATVFF